MREELDALIAVGWGESSRQQQRVSHRFLQARPGEQLWSDRGLAGSQRSRGSIPDPGVRALWSLGTTGGPGPERDVGGWHESSPSWRSHPDAEGSGSQCQRHRVVKREVEVVRLKRPAFHQSKGKQTLLRTKTSRAEGKWKHGEERAII